MDNNCLLRVILIWVIWGFTRDVTNQEMVIPLNQTIKMFSGELQTVEGELPLVQMATLACAYLYIASYSGSVSKK